MGKQKRTTKLVQRIRKRGVGKVYGGWLVARTVVHHPRKERISKLVVDNKNGADAGKSKFKKKKRKNTNPNAPKPFGDSSWVVNVRTKRRRGFLERSPYKHAQKVKSETNPWTEKKNRKSKVNTKYHRSSTKP